MPRQQTRRERRRVAIVDWLSEIGCCLLDGCLLAVAIAVLGWIAVVLRRRRRRYG